MNNNVDLQEVKNKIEEGLTLLKENGKILDVLLLETIPKLKGMSEENNLELKSSLLGLSLLSLGKVIIKEHTTLLKSADPQKLPLLIKSSIILKKIMSINNFLAEFVTRNEKDTNGKTECKKELNDLDNLIKEAEMIMKKGGNLN